MENAAWEMQTRQSRPVQAIIENQPIINTQHKLGKAKYEHKSTEGQAVWEQGRSSHKYLGMH